MAPVMARLTPLLLLPLLFLSAFADSGRCFFPNGKLANFAAGCWDANGTQTALCCQSGDLCLSNRICASKLETNGGELRYYRGSCLDMSWSDPGCPRYCVERDRIDRIVPMRRCEEPPTKWFCGNGDEPADDDCKPAGDDVEVPDGIDVYATAGVTPEPSPVTSSAEESPTTAPGDSTEDQDPARATHPPDTIHPSPEHPGDTKTASSESVQHPVFTLPAETTPAASPTATAPSSTPPQNDDAKSSAAVPIGVGVAVGTSILIAGSVLVFFYQRRRRRQAPVRAETPPPFEFSFINNQAPGWLGPSYGASKMPEPPHGREGAVHGNNRKDINHRTPEIGGNARYELP